MRSGRRQAAAPPRLVGRARWERHATGMAHTQLWDWAAGALWSPAGEGAAEAEQCQSADDVPRMCDRTTPPHPRPGLAQAHGHTIAEEQGVAAAADAAHVARLGQPAGWDGESRDGDDKVPVSVVPAGSLDSRRSRWRARAPRRRCVQQGLPAMLLGVLCASAAVCQGAHLSGPATIETIAPRADGTCAAGYESCLESGTYGSPYQQLGSDPVHPDLWNKTYTSKGIEYVEAAMATGCAFVSNHTLIFANTKYKNILVFQAADASQPWSRTHAWPTPCAPRGLAMHWRRRSRRQQQHRHLRLS